MAEYVSKPKVDQTPVQLTIDGVDYWAVPGKKSGAVIALMDAKTNRGTEAAKILLDWFGSRLNAYDRTRRDAEGNPVAFDGDQGPQVQRLKAALKDDDGPELETVIEAINGLIAEIAARPTGSPSA